MTESSNINIELIKPLIKEFPVTDNRLAAFSYMSLDEYPIHSHLHMEIIYVAEGSISVKVGVSDYVLHTGEFTIINPFELHALHSTGEDNRIFILEISTDFYDPCFEGTIFVSAYYLYENAAGKDFEKIMDTLRKIFDLHLSAAARQLAGMQSGASPVFPAVSDECSAEYERILLRSLINYFELHFTSEYFLLSDHKENTLRDNALQANRLKSILTYFYEHFPQKIQLQDVADVTFVNRYHISHLIKSGIGLTFSELLQHIRIEKAEVYLLGTELPISQIVYELGFSSYRYFNQHFKSLFHMTPAAYRKKYSHDTIRYRDISYRRPVTLSDIDTAIRRLAAAGRSSDVQTIVMADITKALRATDIQAAASHTSDDPENSNAAIERDHDRYIFPQNSTLYDTPLFPSLLLGHIAVHHPTPAAFAEENPQFFAPEDTGGSVITGCGEMPASACSDSAVFCGSPGNTTLSGLRKASFYMKELMDPFMHPHTISFPGGYAVRSHGSTELLFYNAPAELNKILDEITALEATDMPGSTTGLKEYLRRYTSMPSAEWILDLRSALPDEHHPGELMLIRRDLKLELDAFCQLLKCGMLEISEDIIRLLNDTSSPDAIFETIQIPDQAPDGENPCTITLPPFGVCRITLTGL